MIRLFFDAEEGETRDPCPACGERILYLPCLDCETLFCDSCGARCECGAQPARIDLPKAVAGLPSTWTEMLKQEGA